MTTTMLRDASFAVPDVTLRRPGPLDPNKDSAIFSNWTFTNRLAASP